MIVVFMGTRNKQKNNFTQCNGKEIKSGRDGIISNPFLNTDINTQQATQVILASRALTNSKNK